MKIGIFYICTGKYSLFWEDFYNSFEKNFCKNSDLYFYIFTDQDISLEGKKNIKLIKIQNQPWPLITLLRFHYFTSVEQDVINCDYLFFFNANMVCSTEITENEILPSNEEKLVFVKHPGYYNKKRNYMPYDRNPQSKAYIPFNKGKYYVIGAVEGGETKKFLEMSHILKNNIEVDLKKNIIAKWHDESQLNHYVALLDNYKILHPGFCYPVGFDIPFDKKISGVSKQAKFDVKSFKFINEKESLLKKCSNYYMKKINPVFQLILDTILLRNIKED